MVLRTAAERAVVFTERSRAGELWDDAERAGDAYGLGHAGAEAVDRLTGRGAERVALAGAGEERRPRPHRRNGMGLYGEGCGRLRPKRASTSGERPVSMAIPTYAHA